MPGSIVVSPAVAARWSDVETVFGTRGDPASCWCQYILLSGAEWKAARTPELRRALQRRITEDAPAPGVIAYRDGEPAGWCAVEPRPAYERLRRTRLITQGSSEDPDDASVWAVTCFVVRVGYRRQGVSAALLDGAVEHARANGARVIEGYPIDTAAGSPRSSADLYYGVLSVFEAAGFTVQARSASPRVLVRLEL